MTRQPHIFFIVLTAAFVPFSADACARMQPVAAFVVLNDQDGDRALNLTEWLAASTGDNLIASFKLNDPEDLPFTILTTTAWWKRENWGLTRYTIAPTLASAFNHPIL